MEKTHPPKSAQYFREMYQWLKPMLLRMDPERAHYRTMALLGLAVKFPGVSTILKRFFRANRTGQEVEVCGLRFPNPVGLAAGFDKDARWLRELSVLGFGFVEIGTLTPRGQDGNAKPRLFRLIQDEGLINRMGFNNGGVSAAVERLRHRPAGLIVGGNIGKNKLTSNERAAEDYRECFRALHPHVDYFAVNVSSPNTPNLRALQDREPLEALLREVMELNAAASPPRPVFLKIAPDLTDSQLDDIVAIVQGVGVSGVIATNTTIDRSGLQSDVETVEACGAGGLSGTPVRARSTEVIRYLSLKSGGSFPIIGVGGVDSAAAAQEKLDAGASLVQVYSGMIYRGPGLVRNILAGLR